MNNKELISAVSAKSRNRKIADTQRLLNSLTDIMGDHFLAGDTVVMNGLGTFEVRKKMERIIVNPGTGQRMLVPPKLVLNFKPHLALKELRNKGVK